jgi:hypothetical protein
VESYGQGPAAAAGIAECEDTLSGGFRLDGGTAQSKWSIRS